MILKLKTLLKFFTFFFINLMVFPSKKIKLKSLLLLRLDAIGDYVLFRNYIEVLKKSKKYKDYSITLVGNSAWKSISEELDVEFIYKFIWLDKKKFNRSFIYRYKKLQEICLQGYEVVLSPVYSREFFFADNIVKLINAEVKVGSIGDNLIIKQWQKNISDKYYDQLIVADNKLMFEFNRNKGFFENLLDEKIELKKPCISLMASSLVYELPKNYAVIFIGASEEFRKWNIKKFAQIASYLKEKYGYSIVLCGGPSDRKDTKKFSHYFQEQYLDLVGKTSLLELLYVIDNGSLIVSNETSAPHFAIALDMENVFVISNGNHYGKFTPYPQSITENYHVVYHPQIEKDLGDYKKLSNSYGYGSTLDINRISVDSVKCKIDSVLE